jgi:hypothetical protein
MGTVRDQIPTMCRLLFGMALIGVLICVMGGVGSGIPGWATASIATLLVGVLLLIETLRRTRELKEVGWVNPRMGQPSVLPWAPVLATGVVLTWYFTIVFRHNTRIQAKEMPNTWYSFGQLTGWMTFAVLLTLISLVFGSEHSGGGKGGLGLKAAVLGGMGKDKQPVAWVMSLLLCWLVLIQYVISTYFVADG